MAQMPNVCPCTGADVDGAADVGVASGLTTNHAAFPAAGTSLSWCERPNI
ncbi:MAG: hypothetical protein ACXVUE_23300 [Solirubrobacteraceae bacterium]